MSAELWSGSDEDLVWMRGGERVTNELTMAGRAVSIVAIPYTDRSGSFADALVLALDTTPTIRRL